MAKIFTIDAQEAQRSLFPEYLELGKGRLEYMEKQQSDLKKNIITRISNRKKIRENQEYINGLRGHLDGMESNPELYLHKTTDLIAPSKAEEAIVSALVNQINFEFRNKFHTLRDELKGTHMFDWKSERLATIERDLSNMSTAWFFKANECPSFKDSVSMDRWEAYVLETEYTFNPIDGMNYKNEDSTFEYDVQQIETYLNTMAHYLDSSEGKYLFELQNFRDNMSAEVLLKLSDFIDDRTDKYKKKIEYFSKEYGDQKELGILVDNLAKPFVIEKAQIGILLEEENRLKAETLSKSTDLERINEWIKSLKEANLVSGDELIIKGTVNGGYMDGKIVDLSIPIHSIELGTNENNEVGIQYSFDDNVDLVDRWVGNAEEFMNMFRNQPEFYKKWNEIVIADIEKELSDQKIVEEPTVSYASNYHLGGDYVLVVDGGQYLEGENTVNILKWGEPFSGSKAKVVAVIRDLTKSEAKEMMSNPFDVDLEYSIITIGDSGAIENIRGFSEVLVTLGELSNDMSIPENIAYSFAEAGKDDIAKDIRKSINKHIERVEISNQLSQMTKDQRKVIELSIGQEFRSEQIDRINEYIAEENGLQTFYETQQQDTSGFSESISDLENQLKELQDEQEKSAETLQKIKETLEPDQKYEVEYLIDHVHYEPLNELMGQTAVREDTRGTEASEDLQQLAKERAQKIRESKEVKEARSNLSPDKQNFLSFFDSLTSEEKTLFRALNDSKLEYTFFQEDPIMYALEDNGSSKEEEYMQLKNTVSSERINEIEQYFEDTVGYAYQWSDKELTVHDIHSLVGSNEGSEFTNEVKTELNNQRVDVEERTQDSFFDEKEQVIEMYSKFLEGTRLSYEDRSIITSFDQKVSSFEQMQMRLETIGKIKIENPHIDLSIKEAALEGTRGEEAEMNAITSAEYFELSKNERAEPFLQEKNYTKEPVFSSVQDARNWIFEQQVTYMQEWLSVQDSSLFGEHEQEVIDSLEVEFKNGRTQMKLLYIDDRYKLPVTSNSVEQILENIFKNAPTLVSNAMDFVNEKSLTFENNVLDSLATLYELKDDMAFTSENYAKIFGYPSISHERDILKNIRQQRSEQLFDWVYNETYPLGTTIEYRHDRLLTLDKKIVDGHQFFLADENTELMIRSSPKSENNFECWTFTDAGNCETFSFPGSKIAAEYLSHLNAAPCSLGSMDLLAKFMNNDRSQELNKHLVQNQVMRETYREETGRSM